MQSIIINKLVKPINLFINRDPTTFKVHCLQFVLKRIRFHFVRDSHLLIVPQCPVTNGFIVFLFL